jgi:hypothetical protein
MGGLFEPVRDPPAGGTAPDLREDWGDEEIDFGATGASPADLAVRVWPRAFDMTRSAS